MNSVLNIYYIISTLICLTLTEYISEFQIYFYELWRVFNCGQRGGERGQ